LSKVRRSAHPARGRPDRRAAAAGAGNPCEIGPISRVLAGAAAVGPEVALRRRRKAVNVAQRMIEVLIGRLITDEQFRLEFLEHPERTLLDLCDRGLELSRTEIAALVGTDPTLWARTADAIDPRLQKASLKNEVRMS